MGNTLPFNNCRLYYIYITKDKNCPLITVKCLLFMRNDHKLCCKINVKYFVCICETELKTAKYFVHLLG